MERLRRFADSRLGSRLFAVLLLAACAVVVGASVSRGWLDPWTWLAALSYPLVVAIRALGRFVSRFRAGRRVVAAVRWTRLLGVPFLISSHQFERFLEWRMRRDFTRETVGLVRRAVGRERARVA